MSKVSAIAKLTAAPGKRDELVAALSALVDAAQDEVGTEMYVLHQDANEPAVVWVYELYADGDAFAAHSSSDAMKALGPKLASLLGGPFELHLTEPVRAKGIAV